MEQNESRNTVSADEKGRLSIASLFSADAICIIVMHTVQKSNLICRLHVTA